jgi:K+-transporting ATPase ATPase C chain
MLKNAMLREAIALTLVLMALTGLVYPGVVTGVAQVLFPHQANGSLVTVNGQVIGSELIAQQFSEEQYFHPRPSAGAGYNAAASAGTNKGPTDLKLADTLIAQAVDTVVRQDGAVKGQIPSDLVTSSGSGLDPHISPASAELQVARVARMRTVSPEQVRALVGRYTEGRQLGFLGDPRVNVLKLNLALDSLAPMPSAGRN